MNMLLFDYFLQYASHAQKFLKFVPIKMSSVMKCLTREEELVLLEVTAGGHTRTLISLPDSCALSVHEESSGIALSREMVYGPTLEGLRTPKKISNNDLPVKTPWTFLQLLKNCLPAKGALLPTGLVMTSLLAFWFAARSTSNPLQSIAIMLTLMGSACVSSVVGFAFSAIAGASLYHFVASPVEAVKIMLWSSIAIQVYSVIRLWRFIQWPRLIPFLAGGFVTIVPFCWLVIRISPRLYLSAIGLFLATYGIYMSLRKPLTVNCGPRSSLTFSVISGALGGMTGPFAAFPGAAITIWCGMQGWDKMRQRSTFQPYILIMQIVTLVIITLMGSSKNMQATGALFAIPAVLGCHVGLLLFERLSNQQFNRLVHGLLIISGASMILKIFGG